MNTKRIGKWVIVLFLLAALPGLTAVMAQGQEPVVAEPGESAAAIPWQNTETEPNNVRANANGFRTVQGGVISSNSDVDFFKVHGLNYSYDQHEECDTNTLILIDIEAQSIGSPLQALINFYAPDGVLTDTAYYNSATDPIIYFNVYSGDCDYYEEEYFLSVQAYNGNGGANHKYQVLVSNPLLISAAAAGLGTGNVDGIPFQAGDILAWSEYEVGSTTYEKWVMLLDLSDLGVKGNISNIAGAWRNSDFLLLGFAANVTLPGGTVAKAWDVVLFDPSQVGPNTTGSFQLWWRGAEHGLTTTAEKLDAIDWPNWAGAARLYASTAGTASAPKAGGGTLKLADEDVGLWGTANHWYRHLDHSTVPGMAIEDVIGLSYSHEALNSSVEWYDYDSYTVVIQGTALCGASPQVPITQKDIVTHVFEFWDDSYDTAWSYHNCQLSWRGPDHGWNYNIDAIEFYFDIREP